jgi:hypothetical protein
MRKRTKCNVSSSLKISPKRRRTPSVISFYRNAMRRHCRAAPSNSQNPKSWQRVKTHSSKLYMDHTSCTHPELKNPETRPCGEPQIFQLLNPKPFTLEKPKANLRCPLPWDPRSMAGWGGRNMLHQYILTLVLCFLLLILGDKFP